MNTANWRLNNWEWKLAVFIRQFLLPLPTTSASRNRTLFVSIVENKASPSSVIGSYWLLVSIIILMRVLLQCRLLLCFNDFLIHHSRLAIEPVLWIRDGQLDRHTHWFNDFLSRCVWLSIVHRFTAFLWFYYLTIYRCHQADRSRILRLLNGFDLDRETSFERRWIDYSSTRSFPLSRKTQLDPHGNIRVPGSNQNKIGLIPNIPAPLRYLNQKNRKGLIQWIPPTAEFKFKSKSIPFDSPGF